MNLFNRKNGQKHQVNIINPDKELKALKQEQLKKAKENGQNIAKNITWAKDEKVDLNNIPFIVEVRSTYQSVLNRIGAIFSSNLSVFKSEYEQVISELGNDENFKSTYSEITDLETERDNTIADSESDHNAEITDKKQEVETLKIDNKNIKTELNSKTKHNLKPRYVIAGIIMFILILGEIYLNKDAFSYTGLNTTAAFLVGMAVATFTFMTGVSKASIIRKPSYKIQTKILVSIGLMLLVMAVYYTLGTIRVSLMASQSENEGIFGLSSFHFMSFNMAFYIAIFCAKYFIFPNPKLIQENDEYNVLSNKLKKNLKSIKSLNKIVFNAFEEKNKKRQKINAQYVKRINTLKELIKTQVKLVNKSALNFNRELALAINFYEQTNADYKSCTASFVNYINLYRQDKGIQTLMVKIDNLKNPFTNIQFITVISTKPIPLSSKGISHPEKSAWEILAENETNEVNYSFINNNSK